MFSLRREGVLVRQEEETWSVENDCLSWSEASGHCTHRAISEFLLDTPLESCLGAERITMRRGDGIARKESSEVDKVESIIQVRSIKLHADSSSILLPQLCA